MDGQEGWKLVHLSKRLIFFRQNDFFKKIIADAELTCPMLWKFYWDFDWEGQLKERWMVACRCV